MLCVLSIKVANQFLCVSVVSVVDGCPRPRGNSVKFSWMACVAADGFVNGSDLVATKHREGTYWLIVESTFESGRSGGVVVVPSSG